MDVFESFCLSLPRATRLMRKYCDFDPAQQDPADMKVISPVLATSDHLFQNLLHMTAMNRKYCMTVNGGLGYVPLQAKPGDAVCMLYGRKVLYVLRPDGDDHYRLIGEACMCGLMQGEAVDEPSIEPQDFKIR